jgi:hypothetical protein
VCDIINGFRLGPAFLAHGIATFAITAISNELGAGHILTPVLVVQLSSIFLTILRADFFTPTMQLLTQASFALLFFLSRIVLGSYASYGIIYETYKNLGDCFPPYIFHITLLFGGFFHCLNLFWFVKLVNKIKAKLTGKDSMDVSEKMD